MNCWEYKKCGREVNGKNVASLGVCPASTEKRTNGVHNGKNGGRCCWALASTLCGGEMQGSFAQKVINCLNCDFFLLVKKEQHQKTKESYSDKNVP